jgi:hypothetical protein
MNTIYLNLETVLLELKERAQCPGLNTRPQNLSFDQWAPQQILSIRIPLCKKTVAREQTALIYSEVYDEEIIGTAHYKRSVKGNKDDQDIFESIRFKFPVDQQIGKIVLPSGRITCNIEGSTENYTPDVSMAYVPNNPTAKNLAIFRELFPIQGFVSRYKGM